MTLEEIRSEIARITALVAQLQAKLAERIAAVPQAFAVDLHYGLRNNAEVRRLQEFLIERGHLAPGLNTGNYLSLTVAAVRAYQEARGITPSTGNFGPRTRAAVNTDLGLSP
jgi:peptidoglycan hydrolase-like protein with peptidoglycan-binding domain